MSSNDLYDVIVAGGGPGGATAAYYLGEAGKKVLVLEKEHFPRYKACGGATSARLLEGFPFDFEPVIEAHVRTVTYACRGEAVTFAPPECPTRMTMRADLDEFLLEHAQAELRQGDALVSVEERSDRVIVTTRLGRRFEGRYLIGADGPNSAVAHALGLRRNKIILGAIEVEAPVPPEIFQRFKEAPVFIFGEIDMGYLWIFPKAEHLSVGIGALRPQPGELQGTLRRVMEQYQVPIQGLPMHGHPVPIYTRREKISTARTLLVGDAAGLVDPLNGEGIRYAVQSGRLAAEALLAEKIGQYEKRIHRQIGRSHRVNWLVAQIAYRHQGAFFELFMHNPFARRAFSDSFSEKSSQRALMLRLLGSLPPYLVMKFAGRERQNSHTKSGQAGHESRSGQ
jgi:geranylgeranyl reductase family protein